MAPSSSREPGAGCATSAPLPPWRNLQDAGWLSLWLLVVFRLGLEVLGILSIRLQPVTGVAGDWLTLIPQGLQPWSIALSLWQRWDALWYQQIAEHGYQAGNGTVAFYPLYPLLARLVAFAAGGQIVVAELVVSSVAFAVAIWLVSRLARQVVGPEAAFLTVLLIACSPVGFFLLAPYTEALYLALSVAAFWLSQSGRHGLAGLAGFAAALTRAQGALLALPLAYQAVATRRARGDHAARNLLASALPLLGFAAVLTYDRLVVREPHVGLSALAAWGYRVVPPWVALAAGWKHLIDQGDPIEALNLLSLLGFALLAIYVTRRLPVAYALYVWPYLAVLATRVAGFSPLMSVSRYTLVLFPCFLVLGLWLAHHRWLAAGWLLMSLMLQGLLWQYWLHFGFVA